MKILIILLSMLLICGISGAFLIFALRANKTLNKFALHIGYAYTLIAFYVFYMQINSAYIAALVTVTVPFILVLIRWQDVRHFFGARTNALAQSQLDKLRGISREIIYPVVISLFVLLLAVWPYLLTGWGSYWHSGNYDMEDGLNGRDAYINSLILDSRPFDLRTASGDTSWYDFAQVTGTSSTRTQVNSYKEWYAGDGFRFQYSSLAFWSALFDEPHGIDILLVQALLNLILMAVGIFYLSKLAFCMTPTASAVAAAVSVSGTFYMTTYFAGHAGSMMYGALIPALLYLALAKKDASLTLLHKLIFGGLIFAAIAYTYPHPLVILCLPLLAYWIFSLIPFQDKLSTIQAFVKNNPRILVISILFSAIVLSIVLLGLWQATEGYRLRQDGQYRAWGYTHDWLIIPLYLGLMPSPMEGSLFLGSILGKTSYWLFIVTSSLLALIFSIAFFKAPPPKNSKFLLTFGLFFILEYLIFRYFIIDSYYLYKFLYIHQFILIIGITAYVFTARSRILQAICGFILLANLGSVLYMANGVYQRSYNQNPERYQSLLRLDRTLLHKSFVELTGGDGIAVRQTLKANDIDTILDPRFAEYFIVPSGRDSDITGSQFTETIAETGGLAVKRAPSENYLMIRTWNEPEQFPSDPVLKNTVFRWMGDGKNDNLGIYVIRPSAAGKMKNKFLRICFQKGPSAEGAINMAVTAAGKDTLSQFKLGSGVHCEWIPAERAINAELPLVIRSGAKGKSLLPHDDRRLLYRVFGVGWTDKPYDDTAISFFNAPKDIVKESMDKNKAELDLTVILKLGQGWEAYETYGGENFRWSSASTELILTGGVKDGIANVALDLEPGPSLGTKPLQIEVRDIGGKLIFTSKAISGRNSITLPLSYRKMQTIVYKLSAKSDNLQIAGDPRILNYRVFNITPQ